MNDGAKWARDNMYYLLIGVISLLMVCVLPMFGSEVGLSFGFPDTAAGWVLYAVTKGSGAVCNILIFHAFIKQGIYNVRGNERYIEAEKILDLYSDQDKDPRGPRLWYAETYGKKGVTIFLGSAVSVIGLTSAILTYDVISAISYVLTVVMGLVFGLMQMRVTEDYFTNEFWRYAQKIKAQRAGETGGNKQNAD